jgi:predicted DNA-binding transcriptional regulator AlpA
MDRTTSTKPEPQGEALHLPRPKRFLSEQEVADLLGCTRRALRQRPESGRPPCIKLSPRKRVYAADEVEAWIASLPRSK